MRERYMEQLKKLHEELMQMGLLAFLKEVI